jgi:hypothetical protein
VCTKECSAGLGVTGVVGEGVVMVVVVLFVVVVGGLVVVVVGLLVVVVGLSVGVGFLVPI